MAEKKKVYRIEINGLQESVDLVKSLNSQLDSLDTKLSKLSKQKIKITGEVVTQEPKKVVSGTSSSSSTDKEKELAIQKQLNAELKATAQAEAAVTEEFRKSLAEQMKQQEIVKQTKQEVKDMYSGARDDAGEYTNTLAGLRAELRDLTAEQKKVELGTPEYDALDDRILKLNTDLKALESAHGDFRRNVGNYPTAEVNAFREEFSRLYTEMTNLVKESNELQRELASTDKSSEAYDKLKNKLSAVNSDLAKAKKAVDEFNSSLNASPSKFTINIGDTVREFDNAKIAVKTLTKELQQMALEGKSDTKQFQDTIAVLGKLRTEISNVSGEINSYVGGAKGLSDTVEIMRGMSGIVAIGQGISTLFGGQNKELDEQIKKWMAITLIINGIETQVKAINDNQSIWGNTLKKTWNLLDQGIRKIKVFDNMLNAYDASKSMKGLGSSANEVVMDLLKQFKTAKDVSEEYIDDILNKLIQLGDKERIIKILVDDKNAEDKIQLLQSEIRRLENTIQSLNEARLDPEMDDEKLREGIAYYEQQLERLRNVSINIASGGNAKEELENIAGEIDDIMSDLDSMSDKGIDIKGLKQLTENMKKAASNVGNLNKYLGKIPNFLARIVTSESLVAKGIVMIGTAIKNLGKSMIIFAAMQLAMEAITKTVEMITKLFKGGGLDISDRMEMMEQSTDRADKALQKYCDTLDRFSKIGVISKAQSMEAQLRALGAAATDAAEKFRDFLNAQAEFDIQELGKKAFEGTETGIWDAQNLDQFIDRYNKLTKAVEAGTDVAKQGWAECNEWITTADDSVEQLEHDTKHVLGAMANELNNIDLSKGEEAVKEFERITNNTLYQSALANMHTLFKEDAWAQTLGRLYDRFSTTIDNMKNKAQELSEATILANQDLDKIIEQANINSIADSGKRQKAQNEYNRKQRIEEIRNTLADETKKNEAIAAINKEYDQKERDRVKANNKTASKSGDDRIRIAKQIRDNEFAILKEGLDKELLALKNAMADEIAAAKGNGALILSIEKKYEVLIANARRDWFENQKKTVDKYYKDLIKAAKESASKLAEAESEALRSANERGLSDNEIGHSNATRNMSYDYSIDVNANIENNKKMLDEQNKFYASMLEETKKYLDEKHRLELEQQERDNRENIEAEKARYAEELENAREAEEQRLSELEDMYRKGLVSEDGYQLMRAETVRTYNEVIENAEKEHQTNLETIEKNGQQAIKELEEMTLQERQQAQDDFNRKQIDSISDMYEQIGYVTQREQKKNTSRTTGLFNLSAERKRLKETLDAYKTTLGAIDDEYEKLKQQLNDGKIDFNQFTEAKKQLDELKKKTQESSEETSENLSDLFQNWAKSIDNMAQQVLGSIQQLYSMFSEIQNIKFDNEEEALDREQEMLDRETDIVQKAYDKQAEIVERYKQAINDTEDELSSARGERRLALIDGLAQQREAYLLETEELKKQQLEKEKLDKRKEALQKKQDALEKKRKKAEKQQKLVESIINTALGVTQALGAYPPPASYIFAAAVGALGAIETSLIASQKYAKGGQIDGASHAQGGVKIPTKNGFAEVEGNEFITNKATTMKNLDLLYYVNGIRRKVTLDDMEKFFDGKGRYSIPARKMRFADGGTLPDLNDFNLKQQLNYNPQPTEVVSLVQVVDIASALDNYSKVKVLSGLA